MTDSQQYEAIVRDLLETKLEESIAANELIVQHDAHYIGKSGHNHQIDVSAEFNVAGVKILVLVECKNYAHTVGVDEIMEFATRIDDIGAHKGIVVTTKGFQKGAYKMAQSKGIALVLAVDLMWDICMESPSREDMLSGHFAAKLQEKAAAFANQSHQSALYRYSIEATRHSPLASGALKRLQEAQQSEGNVDENSGPPAYELPIKGMRGYVLADGDITLGDVVDCFSLDDNSHICLTRDGLLSLIALECAHPHSGT